MGAVLCVLRVSAPEVRPWNGDCFVFLSAYEFLMWQHTFAVSACKYEPFDCTVVSSPWLQVVQPNRTQGKPVFYILVWRENSPNYFVFVIFVCFFFILDWTRVYLFGNKPCDSVTISMHAFLFVLYCNAQVVTSSAQRDNRVTGNKTITNYTFTNRILHCIFNHTIWTFHNTLNSSKTKPWMRQLLATTNANSRYILNVCR